MQVPYFVFLTVYICIQCTYYKYYTCVQQSLILLYMAQSINLCSKHKFTLTDQEDYVLQWPD